VNPVAETATIMFTTWGNVRAGDQALYDDDLLTVSGIRVYPEPDAPDFLITSVDAVNENNRPVHLDPPASERVAIRRAHATNDDDDNGPRYRVGSDSRTHDYQVSELTQDRGLVTVIGGLQRWQALAVVAILDPPFQD
jgi:hypothetical protein